MLQILFTENIKKKINKNLLKDLIFRKEKT